MVLGGAMVDRAARERMSMNNTAMNAATKICLLGVAFDTNNLGVAVLTAGLVKCAMYSFPRATISVLDYARKPGIFPTKAGDSTVDIRLMPMRFSIKLFQWNNIAVLLALALVARVMPARLRSAIFERNECLRTIRNADIIGSIAGGDSFSDMYGFERLLYVSLPQILVLLCGKPLVQLPQTFGPFRSSVARVLARFILSRSSIVFSRDKGGLDVVKRLADSHGNDGRPGARFLYDVGFVMDSAPPAKAGSLTYLDKTGTSKPLVGFNISGLLFMGGYSRRNMFHLKFNYRDFVHLMIRRFVVSMGARVVLIPHVFGAVESDLDACLQTFNDLRKEFPGDLFIADGHFDEHETKYIIGACDFFTGARMHSCIAALSQHVPAAAIAYSGKFAGVMDSVGMASLVVDPCANTLEECVRKTEQLFSERGKYGKMLAAKMPEVKNEVLTLFSTVGKLRPSATEVLSNKD
jgi:colanic acid/amylovoran biosynthesis protein